MKINFVQDSSNKDLVLLVTDNLVTNLNHILSSSIQNMLEYNNFEGKFGEVFNSHLNDEKYKTITIISLGKIEKLKEVCLVKLGGKIYKALEAAKLTSPVLDTQNLLNEEMVLNLALGINLRNYSFEKYKTIAEKRSKYNLDSIDILSTTDLSNAFVTQKAVIEGVHYARNIITEPPNVIYPESLANKCKELKQYGLEIEVLEQKQLEELGMGALLGVAQGSVCEPRVVILKWMGAEDKNEAPIAFVGKGVTFDTGGISLKPADGMEEMKYDMGGSATVIGTMISLAARKAKVNVVGAIGLVENMPDGAAQRPSDVVKSMSGQTIEVLNTDAEGRLVLADVLWYTKERFKPKFMVDYATLTGAIGIALGKVYAGLFSNDDFLAEQIFEAGLETAEKVWRLPLGPEYDEDIDSDIADVRNTQKTARAAGSITAAQFLQRFVGDTKWAHLDIASMAWDKTGKSDFHPKGATGFGIRLNNKLVEML